MSKFSKNMWCPYHHQPPLHISIQNGGSSNSSPLPICLVPVPLSVWPLYWVDLNDNGAYASTETFPLPLKLQPLPPSDDHSPKTSGHLSPSTSSSACF
ncbi:hypothetical protein TSUD_139600 [Trifolium subterraneum]|uniref:Uncharacterized protein n=1 Tax=Trifolium subterraneum TaxID=3900 RepID=A0A2Z6P0I6_TRISU|nr:hypothetical protein TSUD_139600 [Trifolium subterraneum]